MPTAFDNGTITEGLGAVSTNAVYPYMVASGSSLYYRTGSWTFNANISNRNYGNPMKDHAIADDSTGGIRPYNISMIPIIIVS